MLAPWAVPFGTLREQVSSNSRHLLSLSGSWVLPVPSKFHFLNFSSKVIVFPPVNQISFLFRDCFLLIFIILKNAGNNGRQTYRDWRIVIECFLNCPLPPCGFSTGSLITSLIANVFTLIHPSRLVVCSVFCSLGIWPAIFHLVFVYFAS